MRRFRYLDALTTAFVVILLVANLVAQKVFRVGPFHLIGSLYFPAISTSGAMVLFPITYIFGDVFTEVYGYSASRRAIWTGFMASAVMTAFGLFAIWLPPAPEFGKRPRKVAGSTASCWGRSLYRRSGL